MVRLSFNEAFWCNVTAPTYDWNTILREILNAWNFPFLFYNRWSHLKLHLDKLTMCNVKSVVDSNEFTEDYSKALQSSLVQLSF